MKYILIVEDDKGLREGIELALRREDLSFTLCGNLAEAEEARRNQEYHLLLLDINLPDGNGYDYLKKIKKEAGLPVIIITANDLEMDEVRGLELGADDFITKPFSLMVLRARIDKVLKRTGEEKKNREYEFGDLRFSFEEMRFYKGDRELIFSRTEQRLLQLLVENQGIILTRDCLIDRLWSDGAEYVDENALSVAVNRLRGKLEENGSGHLQTIYGKGYLWRLIKEEKQ